MQPQNSNGTGGRMNIVVQNVNQTTTSASIAVAASESPPYISPPLRPPSQQPQSVVAGARLQTISVPQYEINNTMMRQMGLTQQIACGDQNCVDPRCIMTNRGTSRQGYVQRNRQHQQVVIMPAGNSVINVGTNNTNGTFNGQSFQQQRSTTPPLSTNMSEDEVCYWQKKEAEMEQMISFIRDNIRQSTSFNYQYRQQELAKLIENHNRTKEAEVRTLVGKLHSVENEKLMLNNELLQIKQEKLQIRQEKDELRLENNQYHEENQTINAAIKQALEQKAKCEDNLTNLESKFNQVEKERGDLQQVNLELNEELKKMKEMVKAGEKEAEGWKSKHDKIAQINKETSSQLQQLIQENAHLKQKNHDLEFRLGNEKTQNMVASQAHSILQNQVRLLTEEKTNLEKSFAEERKKVEEKEGKIRTGMRELEMAQNDLKSAKRKFKETSLALDHERTLLRQSQEICEKQGDVITAQNEKINSQEKEITDLKEKAKSEEDEKNETQRLSQEVIAGLHHSMVNARKKIQKLESDIESIKHQGTEQQVENANTITSLTIQLVEKSESVQRLEEEIKLQQEKVEGLQREIGVVRQELEISKSEVIQQREEVEKQATDVLRLEEENRKLKKVSGNNNIYCHGKYCKPKQERSPLRAEGTEDIDETMSDDDSANHSADSFSSTAPPSEEYQDQVLRGNEGRLRQNEDIKSSAVNSNNLNTGKEHLNWPSQASVKIEREDDEASSYANDRPSIRRSRCNSDDTVVIPREVNKNKRKPPVSFFQANKICRQEATSPRNVEVIDLTGGSSSDSEDDLERGALDCDDDYDDDISVNGIFNSLPKPSTSGACTPKQSIQRSRKSIVKSSSSTSPFPK